MLGPFVDRYLHGKCMNRVVEAELSVLCTLQNYNYPSTTVRSQEVFFLELHNRAILQAGKIG
jgi:hypothetical protein